MTGKSRQDLYATFLRLLDNQLDADRMRELNDYFLDHPEAVEQFADFIYLHEAVDSQITPGFQWQGGEEASVGGTDLLDDSGLIPTPEEDPGIAGIHLGEAATPDRQAEINQIKAYANQQLQTFLAEQQQGQLLQKRARTFDWQESFRALGRSMDRITRRVSLYTVMTSALAACLIVCIAIIQYVKQNRVVATIDSSVQAKWETPLECNELKPGWMFLEEGYARLEFVKGAQVIVQAPCELRLCSPEKVVCQSGKLTATVPERAIGFTIETPNSRIVDYGTEFGVQVDADFDSEIHVFNGEVGVGDLGTSLNQLTPIPKGTAAFMSRIGQLTKNALDNRIQLFRRTLPDRYTLGIPGKQLNLADVVGGGNGFGTGTLGYMVDPFSGRMGPASPLTPTRGGSDYHTVSASPYIDGVFIPCDYQSQLISSEGHVFHECPEDTNALILGVINGPPPHNYQMMLDGTRYGTSQHPCILIHANLGITFDLDALRSAMPGIRMTRFRAGLGVSEEPEKYISDCEFWVLVDGEVRFHRRSRQHKGPLGEVEVPLSPEERFLTLVTTDAGDAFAEREGRTTPGDWCLFTEPVIELVQGTR